MSKKIVGEVIENYFENAIFEMKIQIIFLENSFFLFFTIAPLTFVQFWLILAGRILYG